MNEGYKVWYTSSSKVAGVKVFTAGREDEQSSCAARAAVASATLMRSSLDPRTPYLADFVSCGHLVDNVYSRSGNTHRQEIPEKNTNGQSTSHCPSHHRDIPWVPFCAGHSDVSKSKH